MKKRDKINTSNKYSYILFYSLKSNKRDLKQKTKQQNKNIKVGQKTSDNNKAHNEKQNTHTQNKIRYKTKNTKQ